MYKPAVFPSVDEVRTGEHVVIDEYDNVKRAKTMDEYLSYAPNKRGVVETYTQPGGLTKVLLEE